MMRLPLSSHIREEDGDGAKARRERKGQTLVGGVPGKVLGFITVGNHEPNPSSLPSLLKVILRLAGPPSGMEPEQCVSPSCFQERRVSYV